MTESGSPQKPRSGFVDLAILGGCAGVAGAFLVAIGEFPAFLGVFADPFGIGPWWFLSLAAGNFGIAAWIRARERLTTRTSRSGGPNSNE